MKPRFTNSLAVAALLLSIVAVWSAVGGANGGKAPKETAFERIMRTGTMRCGYVVWAPYLSVDPKTGQMGGVAYDYTMAPCARAWPQS